MKVEAHAFLSEALYRASEEQVWQQIANGASYEGVIGAYLMPDTHVGYGVPVGSVIVTDDTIIQGGSGYDISCGVLYMKAGLTAGAVKTRYERERWVKEVERRVATGKGRHRPDLMPRFSRQKGRRDPALRGEGPRRQRRRLRAAVHPRARRPRRSPRSSERTPSVVPQLGSVGGGNHFVEMQCDRDTGEVFVMVHCGSRGYGWQTADHFFYEGAKVARSAQATAARTRGSAPTSLSERSTGPTTTRRRTSPSPTDTSSSTAFAPRRRRSSARTSRSTTRSATTSCRRRRSSCRTARRSEASCTARAPRGRFPRGTRTSPARAGRRRATRASSPARCTRAPRSSFRCPARTRARAASNHGSGRLLARGEAKRKLEHKQQRIDDEMADVRRTFAGVPIEGIVGNHKHVPLDECAHVYKDLDEVLARARGRGHRQGRAPPLPRREHQGSGLMLAREEGRKTAPVHGNPEDDVSLLVFRFEG